MNRRRIAVAAAAAAVLGLGSIAGTAPAWAHVHVSSADPVRGGTALLTFEVPNESPTGSATTELTVTLPDVASARAETVAGWTASVARDAAAGTTQSVTWRAAPDGGIGADQFGLFRISVRLPDTDSVSFPATQTYADGTVVHWDQPTAADGSEPDRPAPVLSLVAGSAGHSEHGTPVVTTTRTADGAAADHTTRTSDNPARVLAGIALLVGAAALGAVIARRRT